MPTLTESEILQGKNGEVLLTYLAERYELSEKQCELLRDYFARRGYLSCDGELTQEFCPPPGIECCRSWIKNRVVESGALNVGLGTDMSPLRLSVTLHFEFEVQLLAGTNTLRTGTPRPIKRSRLRNSLLLIRAIDSVARKVAKVN